MIIKKCIYMIYTKELNNKAVNISYTKKLSTPSELLAGCVIPSLDMGSYQNKSNNVKQFDRIILNFNHIYKFFLFVE